MRAGTPERAKEFVEVTQFPADCFFADPGAGLGSSWPRIDGTGPPHPPTPTPLPFLKNVLFDEVRFGLIPGSGSRIGRRSRPAASLPGPGAGGGFQGFNMRVLVCGFLLRVWVL